MGGLFIKKGKRLFWEFINNLSEKTGEIIVDEERSSEIELEKQFKFSLKRHKNSKHEEWLQIQCLYNGNDNGNIETSLADLDKDIKKFERYGVALDGFAYASLILSIRSNYLALGINEAKGKDIILTDDVFNNILQMLCEVVIEYYNGIEYNKDTYDMAVNEFESIVKDSDYSMYSLSDIRERLKEQGYIKCGKGRTSNLVRLNKGSEPVRVISFFKEKINHLISNIENKKDEAVSLN